MGKGENVIIWLLSLRIFIINKSDEGYSVSRPGLPGCWFQGETELEPVENIKDAIQEYLAAINESIQMGGIIYTLP